MMDDQLVERVARALCRDNGLCVGFCHTARCPVALRNYGEQARAAIAAMSPTLEAAKTPVSDQLVERLRERAPIVEETEKNVARAFNMLNPPEKHIAVYGSSYETQAIMLQAADALEAAKVLAVALEKAIADATGKPNVWFFDAKDALTKWSEAQP